MKDQDKIFIFGIEVKEYHDMFIATLTSTETNKPYELIGSLDEIYQHIKEQLA